MFLEITIGSSAWYDAIGLFMLLAGFIIGLGAVTVIDIHGFLGRASAYWTEATTRTHKVTKPLIWLGFVLAFIGGGVLYRDVPLVGALGALPWIGGALVLNGCFLSFWVSPLLLRREREGRQAELLPVHVQRAIIASFIISFSGWWSSLVIVVFDLIAR